MLITNRKFYTGFRLAPRAVTLDDLEHQNRGFCGFFFGGGVILGCETHFKSELRRNY